MSSLFPSPAADFDHPFDVLDGCHERIRQNCERIERIAAHLASHGPDADAREAAVAVVRFFDTAGVNHHRDEEDDLFPAVLACVPGEGLEATRALVERLRADHVALDNAWTEMRRTLQLLSAAGDTSLTLREAIAFRERYERHIAMEERELLPLARGILEPMIASHLGERMAARRGVKRRPSA